MPRAPAFYPCREELQAASALLVLINQEDLLFGMVKKRPVTGLHRNNTEKRCAKNIVKSHCPATCGHCIIEEGYKEVECGDSCHPIQWPYWMDDCYPKTSALQDCAEATENRGGIAFSLQDCYDQPGSDMMYCFIYQDKPANPAKCQMNVFDHEDCIYDTEDGSFYILEEKYKERFHVSHVFIKFESIGDVRPSEASIDDIVLKVNNKNNILEGEASTFDDIAWNRGLSPHWSIFSDATSFMTAYGTLRPYGKVSAFADIYGDREGIWIKLEVSGPIEKLDLAFKLRYGRGSENLRRFYIAQVGIGGEFDDYKSFQVLCQAIVAATSIEEPGDTNWNVYNALWVSPEDSSVMANDPN